MSDEPTHDCGHTCCDERHYPFHDHFLTPETCPGCVEQSEALRALESSARDLMDRIRRAEQNRP